MSSSSFNVIRRHSLDATSVRIKELTQQLAKQQSDIAGSQLETDDVRSEGRMDHSTIKVNDERLKFITTLDSANTDFFYEFPTEPDFNNLKVWFMLDHLGAKMRDMSGLGNDALIQGHPTLRRAGLDLGFQQTSAGGGTSATPVMLFNSGTDVVSQRNGEYIYIVDNDSIKFTKFSAGFSVCFRFNCLDFNAHISAEGLTFGRRFAAKTDDATNGWNLIVYPTTTDGTQGGIEMQVTHNGTIYKRRTTGYSINTWYQVIVTYNPNGGATSALRIKIYTAGTENSVDGITTLTLPTHTNLRIGARDPETGFFYGYIHDFRLYMDKVLTQTEITNLNSNEMTIDNITKGRVFVVQYALVSQAMRSKIHKFNVGGDVKRERTHKYNLTAKITRTRTHKYNILINLTRTRTHKYNLVNQALRTRTHRYQMEGVIQVTKTHKYNTIAELETTRTHKYSIGGLQTQYVRFAKTTGASGTTQDITFNGTPQALIVWSDGGTADNTFNDHYVTCYGFSDGTNNACISGVAFDGVTTSDTFSGHKTDKAISIPSTAGVVGSEATVSFLTNTARFTWSTNDASARYIHCLAIWGVNAAEVKTFAAGTTATGNATYNFNNTNLVPRFINAITRDSSSASWSTSWGNSITVGAGISSSKQFGIANMSVDALATTETAGVYSTTNTLLHYDDDTGTAINASASFSSANTGSITLNWTDAPTTTYDFSILAIDATSIDIGIITQPNGVTGTQVTNTATNVGQVNGLMLFTNSQTSTTKATVSALGIGGASGTGATQQGLIAIRDNGAAAISEAVRVNRTGAITRTFTANATSSASTTTTEASVSALGTNQFTLNWGTADANTRKYHYIAFGTG